MAARLLLVDDDRFLLDNMKRYLSGQGFEVSVAPSAEDGMSQVAEQEPDLMVLDLGLPGLDGVSFCRRIRAKWRFPIIMLTARTEALDKVIGLEVGADDYLTKPFEPVELLARVRAQLRRANEYQAPDAPTTGSIEVGALTVDLARRSAEVSGRAVELTSKEFDLLAYLAQNAGRVLERDYLFEKVWGYDSDFNTNSLDVIIYRLRKKLEPGAASPRFLHTVRGFGYKLEAC
jgi:two-component system alkaline phosphatase synthesis response regulator PhoP